MAPKCYHTLISLNEVWPCLPSKYFGKLFDIYQLDIVRLHLWKIGICSSWGELRSHYPFSWGSDCPFPLKILVSFIIFLISFVVGIISWKCEACSSWLEIYPEMGPISLVPGPNSTKFRRANQMDFSLLRDPNILGGSNLLRKMGWNYASGALCLWMLSRSCFRTPFSSQHVNGYQALQNSPKGNFYPTFSSFWHR